MSIKVGIVDYGAGNLFSVDNAIKGIVRNRFISQDPDKLMHADYIIFPGVGSFSDCIKSMKNLGLDIFLKEYAATGKPILSICLGMQMLMTEGSEGGSSKGIGLIEGCVHKLAYSKNSRIPHMGWNNIYGSDMKDFKILNGIESQSSFYFVHSYHVVPTENLKKIYTDFYGIDIVAGFQKDNLFAIQFHPEKSQRLGIHLLKNFLTLGND
jgi:glutamine amidotransferase